MPENPCLKTLLVRAFPGWNRDERVLEGYVANMTGLAAQSVYQAVERNKVSPQTALALYRGAEMDGGQIAAKELAPFLHPDTFIPYRALAAAGLFD